MKSAKNRREFLAALGGLGSPGMLLADHPAPEAQPRPRRTNRLAVSTYSFWQFRHEKLRDLETCIDLAAEMGFDGVEILHRQMQREDNDYYLMS